MAIVDDLLDDFKTYLDMGDDDSQDEELLAILRMGEGFIFDYYGVAINERTLMERVKPIYGGVWYVNKGEILVIDEIDIDGSAISSDDLAQFYYDRNKIILPTGYQVPLTSIISVKYDVGYLDKDEVPYGLRMGLFVIGKKIYNDSQKDTDTYQAITTGVKESVKFIDSIPIMADNLLNAYRIFRL